MSKILIIASLSSSLLRFRGDLIREWLALKHAVLAAAPGLEAEEELLRIGVKYRRLTMNRAGLNPFKDFLLFCKLSRLIRIERPDYLFLYTIKPVIYASLAAYLKPECRVFSMISGLGYIFTESVGTDQLLKKIASLLYKFALRRNEKVFFQNRDDAEEFIALGLVDSDKTVLVNGSGVNIDYYRQVPLPEGQPVFLLIARYLKEKGFTEYIEAAKLVKLAYPEVVFKIVGWQIEGSPSVIDANQIKAWQDLGLVEIYGETSDVRPYIAASSVYVLPSYREGTPRTVLEAMAMGRPIITSDAPGCRETVVEGVNGFLVPIKNAEALAEAMVKFIKKPALMAVMGAESRRIAEEKYDVRKVNEAINKAMGLL